jgi:hypothetical protein
VRRERRVVWMLYMSWLVENDKEERRRTREPSLFPNSELVFTMNLSTKSVVHPL